MSQLIEILDKIPNGHALYFEDALVNRVVDSLRLGNDPVKIIGNLLGIIDAYKNKVIKLESTEAQVLEINRLIEHIKQSVLEIEHLKNEYKDHGHSAKYLKATVELLKQYS